MLFLFFGGVFFAPNDDKTNFFLDLLTDYRVKKRRVAEIA